MVASIIKVCLFFVIVLALTLGAVHLSETGDAVRIVFSGTEYTLGPVQVFIALVALFVLAWVFFKVLALLVAFLRFLAGDQTAIDRYFARSRERKGYEALAEGMLAVASGEGKLAQDKAARAGKLLDKPHLTDLLAAQAAEVAGDTEKASEVYRRLLGDDRTRFVGVRGLMRQKLANGDTETALLLAQKAYALKPKHAEVQDTLLQLQAQNHDWKGARKVLKDKRRQGQLPQDVHIRRDAVLALQEASEVLARGNSISAREAAISANRASPDLIPAAVLAARSYIAQKDMRNAARVLQKTWSVRPHPSIAAAYAEIAPDETAAARLKRFENLMRQNPGHEETRLLRTELNLAAENFPEARRAIGDLAETHPTVRTLSLMAAIERGEGGDDAVVRGFLARAMTASRGEQWVCDKCHNIMADWAPICDSCGSFDTLTWREPDQKRETASATGAEMLPLIVGLPSRAATQAATPIADPGEVVVAQTSPKHDGPAQRTASASPKPAPTKSDERANVAPGMVPRETDWVPVDPSATVTDPEVPAHDTVPVRPDVEPPAQGNTKKA